MNKLHTLPLLPFLTIALMVTAACVPITESVPATVTPSNAITNIVWQWTSVTNQPTQETTEVSNPQSYTIAFREDGTLSGQADCNAFTGTYSQASGFSITIDAVTVAACGEDSLDQQYLQLLSTVVAGGPDGAGNLALENAGGEQRMLFKNGGAPQE